MDIIKTLQEILDIPYPFTVDRLERDLAQKEVHIFLEIAEDYHMGKSWTKHSSYDRKWEHLNLFEYRCFIHCNIPIYQNKKTKKTQAIEVPFASYKRRFTHKYEKRVLELIAIHYNFTEVARQLKITPHQVISIYEYYVDDSYNNYYIEPCKSLGIDETSTKKGHNYITTFVDMETGKILEITDDRSSQAIIDFFDMHPNPTVVEEISMDMSPAFAKGVKECFPHVQPTYDKWHVWKVVFKHLDKMFKKHKKSPQILEQLHFFIEEFERFYAQNDYEAANAQLAFLTDFLADIDSKNSLSKSLKKHAQGILQYIKSKLTNGLLEGINSKIQLIKRKARGFRYVDNFKKLILYVFGTIQPSKLT